MELHSQTRAHRSIKLETGSKELNAHTTFLVIGDVHGQWDCVIDAINSATDILGHVPDLVLQVGDAEAIRSEEDLAAVHVPNKYRSMGLFSALGPGDLKSPVYFIGGNHEPYEMLDEYQGDPPIKWGDNVFYLGRAGAATIHSLNIAWLSGIQRSVMLETRRPSKKERTYYLESEVELTKKNGSMLGDIDVVITHDWPIGIQGGRGTELIRSITEALQPQLHVCGHMHTHHEAVIGKTKLHALNVVPPAGRGENRFGWWRLYRKELGAINCIWIGS